MVVCISFLYASIVLFFNALFGLFDASACFHVLPVCIASQTMALLQFSLFCFSIV